MTSADSRPDDGAAPIGPRESDASGAGADAPRSDWNTLMRLADAVGKQANPVTQIRGRNPPQPVADNGGAQAVCVHDEDWEGVVTSDGTRHEFVTY